MENLEMKWFLIVSDLLIPMIILGILCYGILQQVAVYDVFVKGAKSGFLTVAKIIPTMVGLMVAVEGFRLADLSVGRNRKVYKMDWLSGRIGAAYSCKDVFFFGSNRFAIRYL